VIRLFAVLFPKEKVPLFCRFRKFINQNGGIGNTESVRSIGNFSLSDGTSAEAMIGCFCVNVHPLEVKMSWYCSLLVQIARVKVLVALAIVRAK
jgi:hypothetical protein